MEKLLIFIILVLTGLIYIKLPKIENMDEYKKADEATFQKAIRRLRQLGYSDDILRKVEQIYRKETAHFTSGQFKGTYSAGMEVFGPPPYYGWSGSHFRNTSGGVVGTRIFTENGTGIKKEFLQFPNLLDAVTVLANYLVKYGGNAGRWYSTNPEKQKQYAQELETINVKFT